MEPGSLVDEFAAVSKQLTRRVAMRGNPWGMAPGMTDAFVKEYPLGRRTPVEGFPKPPSCGQQTFRVNAGLALRRNPASAEIGRMYR